MANPSDALNVCISQRAWGFMRASISGAAAVGGNARARDHARLIRSEEKRDARDVFRRADSEGVFLDASGGVLKIHDRTLPLRGAVAAGDALGEDAPGADRVHPDIAPGESAGEG